MNQKMTRRSFELFMAGAVLGGERLVQAALTSPVLASPSPPQAPSPQPAGGVVPTSRCFLVRGRPVFLISGAIHYQRCPHQLWRDRILRAKRAGMNCIETFIPWNFHEPEEGVFDFEGDRDIERFIDACQDLGLYCFLRVGPFVCGEWEAAGYPAWLIGKAGTEFRTMNPVALPYIRRWFEHLVPRIAARQATRGGPVILVQAENEWRYCHRPGGLEYLEFLIRTLRELRIEVPITDCNGLGLSVPGSLKTLGFSEDQVSHYRKEHPNLPVMVYELYTGWGEMWGQPSLMPNSSPLEVRQRTMRALALRAMYNYYMFHGGTNFGFWASNTWKSDHAFITTRYYFTSPVAEGGSLHEMYFAVKSTNLLASNFQDFFCQADEVASPIEVEGSVRVTALRSPQGFMLFVHPRYPLQETSTWRCDGRSPLFSLTTDQPSEEVGLQPGALRLRSGRVFESAEGSTYPLMLPFQFQLEEGCRLDFSNATLLGYGGTQGRRVVLLRGEAGREGLVSVNGREAKFIFPTTDPLAFTVGGVKILAVSREAADRTWFAEGRILIGPAYVGEQKEGKHECWLDSRASVIHAYSVNGEYRRSEVLAEPPPQGLIRLNGWTSKLFPEVEGKGEGWRDIGTPRPVEELGAYYGYSWYRASFDSDDKRASGLFFTRAADRIHVFRNGSRMGIWGRGAQATRDPLPVELNKGKNEFVFLCDNMGRSSEGKSHDQKGILGNVYLDAAARDLGSADWATLSGPPNESWEFRTHLCYSGASNFRFFRLRFQVPFREDEGALLALRWVPQYAWVYVHGHLVGEHGGDDPLVSGFCFNEFVLNPYLANGKAEIEVSFYGEPPGDFSEHLYLFAYPRTRALGGWQFKPWQDPTVEGDVQTSLPACWECKFPKPELPGPLFLVTEGLSKGQVYLNGHAVGRYWEIGPQHSLYLPEPWFQSPNRLVVFDEAGQRPDQVYIIRDSRYPARMVRA